MRIVKTGSKAVSGWVRRRNGDIVFKGYGFTFEDKKKSGNGLW